MVMKTLFYGTVLLAGALAVADAATVTTLGGGPTPSNLSKTGARDGNTLLQAKFNQPHGIAILDDGSLLIADKKNRRLRQVQLPGDEDLSFTSTFARGLPLPAAVAVDSAGNVYAANERNGTVNVYDAAGVLQTTHGGLGRLTAIAVDSAGTIYAANTGGAISWIAPDGSSAFLVGGFVRPSGLTLLNDSTLVVSDSGSHGIYTVDTATGVATLFTGGNGAGFADGPANVARFNAPWGVAAGPGGTLVVADRLNHRVRLVTGAGAVSTIYGVSRTAWERPFAGWRDGAAAQGREPISVAVATNGTIYVTEAYWHTIREVTGSTFGTNAPGTGTNNNNTNVVVGTNIVSFGFESGEASSEFIGAAGQTFFAPVTLTLSPQAKIYSFQMSLTATPETGLSLDASSSRFVPMVEKLENVITSISTNPVTGVATTNTIPAFVPIIPNYTFMNSGLNLLGVGWFERYGETNLYDTKVQDLVTYSIAKNTLFGSSKGGKVVMGAYGFHIPTGATDSDTIRITLADPSGTSDGISQAVPLQAPTTGSLGAGGLNTIKRVTLASRSYVVGDGSPFRWYNAGDFGDTQLRNSDVMEVFQTAVYGWNFKSGMRPSDLFDALDSSNGADTNVVKFGNDVSINSITSGDGDLNVDDVWVTFRRSLDHTTKWFARYWSNGVRQVVEVPNGLSGLPGAAVAVPPVAATASFVRPTAVISVDDSTTTAGAVLTIPVRVSVDPGYLLKIMMLNLTVEALDGSPAITEPVQWQTAPTFKNPELFDTSGPANYAAAWLDTSISGLSGNAVLAFLTVKIPATAGPRAAYRINFEHFSASPNGIGLFDSSANKALLLLSDRSTSTWGDGLSDEWRLRYFGSISAPGSDPNSDPDEDGASNATEFQNGTDPTDGGSF